MGWEGRLNDINVIDTKQTFGNSSNRCLDHEVPSKKKKKKERKKVEEEEEEEMQLLG